MGRPVASEGWARLREKAGGSTMIGSWRGFTESPKSLLSGGRPEIVKKITKPACRPETVIPISAHRREFPSALLFL